MLRAMWPDPKFLTHSPELGLEVQGPELPVPDGVTFPHPKEFLGPRFYPLLCKMVRAESDPKTLYNAWRIVGAQEMLAKSEYLLTSVDFKQEGRKKKVGKAVQ